MSNTSKVLLALSLCLIGTESALACNDGVQMTSTNGEIFTCTTAYPQMGESWRDQRGLIWGDIITAKHVNQKGAVAYCSSIGARLPTVSEFTTLSYSFGATADSSYDYSAQILANSDLNYWVWSSATPVLDPSDKNVSYGRGFSTRDGVIGSGNAEDEKWVRCVKN